MKNFLPTIVTIAFILSAVSCNENTLETTTEAAEVIETPVEGVESPAVEEIDTIGND